MPPSPRTVHVPVMLQEVLTHLQLAPGLTVVDGTIGAGGHSQRILKSMDGQGHLIGLDRDPTMLARAAQVVSGPNVSLKAISYSQMGDILDELQIVQVDRVLLDLGLSSDQLADPHRGFGFDTTGELDMRFDSSTGSAAAELLNSASQDEIRTVLSEFGEERQADAIAREIVSNRRDQPIQTADQLVALVHRVTGHAGRNRSPSVTRVFQALRIAVNQELEELRTTLTQVLPARIRAGGRAVILTFHSLEDRMVKDAFRDSSIWSLPFKKPLSPTPSEIRMNPRSRSAKLRVAVRHS